MKTKIFLIVFILLTSFSLSADQPSFEESISLTAAETTWLEEGHAVIVRVANWPPYHMSDNDSYRGISVDYISYIFDRLDIDYTLVSYPQKWTDALEALSLKKDIDLILTAKITEERKEHMLFTTEYVAPPWVIFTRDDSHFISGIRDLYGKTVAVQEGFVMQSLLETNYPEILLRPYSGIHATELAIEALAVGEVDAYIGNLATGSFFIKQNDLHNVKIAAPTPFGNHANAMAIRDDWPQLVSIINKGLEAIPEATKNSITDSYFSVRYEHGIQLKDILLVIFIAALIGVTIILCFNRINRRLKREIKKRIYMESSMKEYLSLIDKNIISLSIDMTGMIIEVSAAFCALSGYESDELLGRQFRELWSSNMSDMLYEAIMEKIRSHSVFSGEIEKVSKDGNCFWVDVQLIPFYNLEKTLIGYTSIGQDITDKKKVELLSVTDKLTGLYNRLKLDELLSQEIERARRYGSTFSLILLDIDDFKEVNDNYGHSEGDEVLKKIARRLQSSIRVTDTVYRYGGEEFLILCPETALAKTLIMAEHLRMNASETKFPISPNQTISLGVSTYQQGDSCSSVIDRADEELYKAKRAGKNQVCPKEA